MLDLESRRVSAAKTPWGVAWDHASIAVRGCALFKALGVADSAVRVRLVAHAIMACGWRQNCVRFNLFGVKIGNWSGLWYAQDTKEENDEGELYSVPGDRWRAFGCWAESLADHFDRMSSKRYALAGAALRAADTGRSGDLAYYAELKAAKYFTDTSHEPEWFAQICDRVRLELSKVAAGQLEAAAEWAASQVNRPGAPPVWKFFLALLVVGLCVWCLR